MFFLPVLPYLLLFFENGHFVPISESYGDHMIDIYVCMERREFFNGVQAQIFEINKMINDLSSVFPMKVKKPKFMTVFLKNLILRILLQVMMKETIY